MSVLSMAFAATLSLAATPMGSIYGKVVTKASHYVTKPSEQNGYARRQAAPAQALREPLGVVVALEGEALQKEKFDAPSDEVKVEAKALGLEPRLIGCQVGSSLAITNSGERSLKMSGNPGLKDPIAPKETRKITLAEIGVFDLADVERPDAKVTLVVTQNPFVIALDETGEFLFEDLVPGPYTLKIYGRSGAKQVPVVVKPSEREQVTIALKATKKEAP